MVGRIAGRVAPLLGVEPVVEDIREARAPGAAASRRNNTFLVSMQRAFADTKGRRVGLD